MQVPSWRATNVTGKRLNSLHRGPRREVMKLALARLGIGLVAIALGAIACRQNEPLEPKTPPNTPLPDIDRPEEPTPAPTPRLPSAEPDGGARLQLLDRSRARLAARGAH